MVACHERTDYARLYSSSRDMIFSISAKSKVQAARALAAGVYMVSGELR